MKEKTININEKGTKRIAVICGTHGNESHAVKVVQLLMEKTEKEKLFENTDICSINFVLLNETGLLANTREYQEENKSSTNDLNRALPWKAEEDTKEEIIERLKEIIRYNNIIIDVHNSPNCEPCVLVDWNGPRAEEMVDILKDLLAGSFIPVIRHSGNDTIKNYVNVCGYSKFGFTIEIPGMGFDKTHLTNYGLIQDSNRLENFIKSIVNSIDKERKNLEYIKPTLVSQYLYCRQKGIINYTPFCADKAYSNPFYEKGEVICTITEFGSDKVIDVVTAPCKGFLVCVNDSYYTDGLIGEFQPIEDMPELFENKL